MSKPLHRYTVIMERQAEKTLRKLPKEILSRVDRLLISLAEEPRPVGCKKLRDMKICTGCAQGIGG